MFSGSLPSGHAVVAWHNSKRITITMGQRGLNEESHQIVCGDFYRLGVWIGPELEQGIALQTKTAFNSHDLGLVWAREMRQLDPEHLQVYSLYCVFYGLTALRFPVLLCKCPSLQNSLFVCCLLWDVHFHSSLAQNLDSYQYLSIAVRA